jgi:REP element-mobilizing transposase RayT
MNYRETKDKEKTFWSDGYFACSTGDASTETINK